MEPAPRKQIAVLSSRVDAYTEVPKQLDSAVEPLLAALESRFRNASVHVTTGQVFAMSENVDATVRWLSELELEEASPRNPKKSAKACKGADNTEHELRKMLNSLERLSFRLPRHDVQNEPFRSANDR